MVNPRFFTDPLENLRINLEVLQVFVENNPSTIFYPNRINSVIKRWLKDIEGVLSTLDKTDFMQLVLSLDTLKDQLESGYKGRKQYKAALTAVTAAVDELDIVVENAFDAQDVVSEILTLCCLDKELTEIWSIRYILKMLVRGTDIEEDDIDNFYQDCIRQCSDQQLLCDSIVNKLYHFVER